MRFDAWHYAPDTAPMVELTLERSPYGIPVAAYWPLCSRSRLPPRRRRCWERRRARAFATDDAEPDGDGAEHPLLRPRRQARGHAGGRGARRHLAGVLHGRA